MARVTNTIAGARSILADAPTNPAERRWTDDRLIELYNEALRDITDETDGIYASSTITMVLDTADYTIPADVSKIDNVIFENAKLPFASRSELDSINETWRADTGPKILCIITSQSDAANFTVYPIPDADLIAALGTVKVYYRKLPDDVTIATVDGSLELGRIWDNAIKHFIAGMALRDDEDQQNRAYGSEELNIYLSKLNQIKRKSATHFTGDNNMIVDYKGFI